MYKNIIIYKATKFMRMYATLKDSEVKTFNDATKLNKLLYN